ncbi:MAG: SCO family protein [Bradymonadaceae bacterium]
MQTASTIREDNPLPDLSERGSAPAGWLSLAIGVWLLIAPTSAPAQSTAGPSASNINTGNNPKAQKLGKVTFEQNLDAELPLTLQFQNERGETVPLSKYFRADRPVIVVLGYFECPMLCNLVRKSLIKTLADIELQMGRDYTVVSVSIDPGEGPKLARQNRNSIIEAYRKNGGAAPKDVATSGWHNLTGDKQAIKKLADVVGFQYRYDEQKQQYMHPSGFAVAAPDGTIARYFFGVTYQPRDLRLGLVDASKGKVGSPIDQVLLRCYQYNPETGSYSFAIMRVLRVIALATAFLLAFSIWSMFRDSGRLDEDSVAPDALADETHADEEGS